MNSIFYCQLAEFRLGQLMRIVPSLFFIHVSDKQA
jgi:uncharacterized membrane protein